ncbi:hypothetical protein QJS66_11105 [Kocuria rhizophila]|nr:hypothetical protein QJS66_11105 [Kocuria rhizophila]
MPLAVCVQDPRSRPPSRPPRATWTGVRPRLLVDLARAARARRGPAHARRAAVRARPGRRGLSPRARRPQNGDGAVCGASTSAAHA